MRAPLLFLPLLLVACATEPGAYAPAAAPASEPTMQYDASEPDESERLAELMREVRRSHPRRSEHFPALRAIEAIGTDEAQDSLLAYAAERRAHSDNALGVLAGLRSAKLPGWLTEHAGSLDGEDWSRVAGAIMLGCRDARYGDAGKVCWRDPVVMRLLLEQALTNPDHHTRAELVDAFAQAATLAEARRLNSVCATPVTLRLETACSALHARFDAFDLTERMRQRLTQASDAVTLKIIVRDGLVAFQRYDLLPELRGVLARLQAGELTGESYALGDLRENIPVAIQRLEAARAAGVEPGLPLDWPETPDDAAP